MKPAQKRIQKNNLSIFDDVHACSLVRGSQHSPLPDQPKKGPHEYPQLNDGDLWYVLH